jgi:hypothetical protein
MKELLRAEIESAGGQTSFSKKSRANGQAQQNSVRQPRADYVRE